MAVTVNQTTLSVAATKTADRVTVASASTIAVKQLLFVRGEAMLVLGVDGTVITVERGFAGTAPVAHASGAVVYTGPANYFSMTRPSGTGVAANEVALPRIVLPRGEVYNLDADGNWYKQEQYPREIDKQAQFTYTATGALTVAGGLHKLGSGGVIAMTLANPTAEQEGLRMSIRAITAQAHTVTVTGGFAGAGAGADVGTFGGAIGDGLELIAVNLLWHVIALRNVTLA